MVTAYCTKDDLLTGDIPLAGKYGDGSSFVQMAADEIDAEIGHLYVTPIIIEDASEPMNRPSVLTLKKINQLLASGRIILDMAAGGEDHDLHRYGKSMVDEALLLLGKICDGKMILRGAEQVKTSEVDVQNTAVSVTQEDSASMVQTFYQRFRSMPVPGYPTVPGAYDVDNPVS